MTTRRNDKNYKPLKRPCSKCDKAFQPNSKFNFVCEDCFKKTKERKMKRLRKYTISEIRGYAGKLFREGKIQVPLVSKIESFLDSFENYKEVQNESNKTKKK